LFKIEFTSFIQAQRLFDQNEGQVDNIFSGTRSSLYPSEGNAESIHSPDWCLVKRKRIPKAHRKKFDSLFILTAWRIWNERNDRILRRNAMQPEQLAARIEEEMELWCMAGRTGRVCAEWSLASPTPTPERAQREG
ncbi:hypothetical protein BAE44_0013221, partial [Dichanthelium oligosanthes]